jgi:hypothetical protein
MQPLDVGHNSAFDTQSSLYVLEGDIRICIGCDRKVPQNRAAGVHNLHVDRCPLNKPPKSGIRMLTPPFDREFEAATD